MKTVLTWTILKIGFSVTINNLKMKTDTIEKANRLIKNLESIEQMLDRIVIDKNNRQYLSDIRITKHEYNSNDRVLTIELDNNGKITSQQWLSSESVVILDYTVKQFYDSIVKLFESEKVKFTKELENLKD